ncbi:MAG: glycine--tRNA ligase subunit beta [Rhabdochlamydiaceae bacterium]
MLTFQQLISKLTAFWENKGCVIHQGYDLEMGAGTFNPATFLRCLGPESYKTAYVEPSRRPSDGRFGQNPNRVQLFHQFQVIIKPSHAKIQQDYLDSLAFIGLDVKNHDIRFVHDDWESPTIGAWGLGWEVWCDGMEVTQFTYFQAIGSQLLDPIPVEITYGIERLAMFLQGVDNIFDIKWNDHLTLRDISLQNEVEWSQYNFEEASTEMWIKHFEDFEKEAKILISKNLPIPAYDFVAKASHAFNLLDARGAISVTERTGYISRIRELSRLIAVAYVESRELIGFPLKEKYASFPSQKTDNSFDDLNFNPCESLLIEIGSEELPATFIPLGEEQIEKKIIKWLKDHELSCEQIHIFATPRRLAVFVKNIPSFTIEKAEEKKGPPLSSVYDTSAHPTPQGMGFFKSMNATPPDLEKLKSQQHPVFYLRTINGIEYIYAKIKKERQSTFNLLKASLAQIILSLDFPKKMRWGTLNISYPRPLKWIVALFGSHVIPFQIGDIVSGNESWGHRQRSHSPIMINHPDQYEQQLIQHFVIASSQKRKESILSQLQEIEKKSGLKTHSVGKVLKEVVYLTEWPILTIGTFDPSFLKAPKEVLISEMVEHQKYFPLEDLHGQLINQFIITADNEPNSLIRKGNEKVLSARLSDGVFLYEQDSKTPLEELAEKLKTMTFQKDLGSVYEKSMRLHQHAQYLQNHLNIGFLDHVSEAALLSKADLASHLVKEFPELQGCAGKYYALQQNHPNEVAMAIEEHWKPIADEAPLPETPAGIILSLADKIDNLLGYYLVGLKPSSSSDPYALRRQSLGILKILISHKLFLDLRSTLASCLSHFSQLLQNNTDLTQIINEIQSFIANRAKGLFEDLNFSKDVIEAVSQKKEYNPYDLFCKMEALSAWKKEAKGFNLIHEAYKRMKGQVQNQQLFLIDESLFLEKAEKNLHDYLKHIAPVYEDMLTQKKYSQLLELLGSMHPFVDNLFNEVKIMAEDPHVRKNRIALIQKLIGYFDQFADFNQIK